MSDGQPASGVSIAICCHNSAARIARVLERLHCSDAAVPWEVLVIDNASTDATAAVARECWRRPDVPLRVVPEPRVGLSNARVAAIRNSEREVIAYLDDDNLVLPGWLDTLTRPFFARPDVGACGGVGEFPGPAPTWFARFQRHYAVGPQAEAEGDVTDQPGQLYGAGLALRRRAAVQLLERGFHPLLSGRAGMRLTSGEDTEWCWALRLAGWRLWYVPGARFIHQLDPARLDWMYVRRLSAAFGAASALLDPYHFALLERAGRPLTRTQRSWTYQFGAAAKEVLGAKLRLAAHLEAEEGSAYSLVSDFAVGRLRGLWHSSTDYAGRAHRVRSLLG